MNYSATISRCLPPMLEKNIPDNVPEVTRQILADRYPNYCETCGREVILAGGWQRLEPGKGLFYEHIDVVLTCLNQCFKRTMMSGLDQAKGLEYYQDAPRRYDAEFEGVIGYCEHHGETKVTKDIESADGSPLRQYKCPDCDRGMAVKYVG